MEDVTILSHLKFVSKNPRLRMSFHLSECVYNSLSYFNAPTIIRFVQTSKPPPSYTSTRPCSKSCSFASRPLKGRETQKERSPLPTHVVPAPHPPFTYPFSAITTFHHTDRPDSLPTTTKLQSIAKCPHGTWPPSGNGDYPQPR